MLVANPRDANSPAEFLDFCAQWAAALAIATALMAALGSALLVTYATQPYHDDAVVER